MRIALVSQEYPPETAKGGIGTQTHAKAHGLAALGHEVWVVSRSTDENRHDYADGAVRVTRIPGAESKMALHTEIADWVTYSARVARALDELHAEERLDLVEFPEWGAEGYVHLINRTQWNSVPTVIHLHGPLVMFGHALGWPPLDSEFFRTGTFLESTCLRLADAVYSSSHCSKDWCVRHYGLDGSRIPVIHAGIDTEWFAPRPGPKDARPTIVSVGKLVPNKGFGTLVEAACQVARTIPDLRLRIIGSGSEQSRRALERQAAEHGFPDLLDLAGFVPRDSLPRELSKAHLFVSASAYEGGPGFVTLEAMACGLPVVVCSGSGADEEVMEGTGFTVPPRNVEALAGAVQNVLTNAAMRESAAQAARTHVAGACDSKECVQRINLFFREVTSQNEASGQD